MSEVTFTARGGANSIGRSCYVLGFGAFSVLVDFGAGTKDGEQEPEYLGLPGAVILTHAHRDHSGMLPRLLARPEIKKNKVPCWATFETVQLARWIWDDELNIARQEYREYPFMPEDVEHAQRHIQLFKPGRTIALNSELTVTPFRGGHILGAVWLLFQYRSKHYAITGDISLRSHEFIQGADVPKLPGIAALIRESTYVGQRPTDTRENVKACLASRVLDVLEDGGRAVVTSLSIDRMQEGWMALHDAGVDRQWPVWVVGGAKPTQIYQDYAPGGRVLGRMRRFANRQHQADFMKSGEPGVILASSGMVVPKTPSYAWAMEVLEDEASAIFMLNWQDPCQPGGIILDGEYGERLALPGSPRKRCRVERFPLSTHAMEDEMAEMEKRLRPEQVIHVHGEDSRIQAFIDAKRGKGPSRIKSEVGNVIPL